MSAIILTLNIGSSSIKFAWFDAADLAVIERGAVTGIGRHARVAFQQQPDAGVEVALAPTADAGAVIHWLLDLAHGRTAGSPVAVVGHRVVHGGHRFDRPVCADAEVMSELDVLVPLAPAHQPAALAAIRTTADLLPGVPQVICFDTAFHRHQSRLDQWYALPRDLSEAGVVRYGFHGLSYEYIASVLPEIAGPAASGRVIVAHLGHGASLCALHGLRSVGTTMGFTPLDGLMMGTRCGSIDPGVLLYLLQQGHMPVAQLADLLANRSGLLGVSGISDDIQVLEASDDPRAREALEMFEARAATAIAGQCATLQGLDALVFTGGIGEHAAGVRARISERLRWLGIALDAGRNARDAQRISEDGAAVAVFVIPTDEEIVIARAARQLLGEA
jgi:acetate kinase